MGRYWSVLLLVACSSGKQEVDGSGGAADYTVDAVSPSGGSSAVISGGSSTKTTSENAPSTGGVTFTGGTSGRTVTALTVPASGGKTSIVSTVSYGGAAHAATSAMGGVTSLGGAIPTGGTESTSTTTSECPFLPERPNEGGCSVYSKGRFYCLLGVCTPSDLSTGYYLDCDHDGTPETRQTTDDNCGACGNSCRELFMRCKATGYTDPWHSCQ